MGSKEQFGLQREIEAAESLRGAPTSTVQLRSYAAEYFKIKGNLIEAKAMAAKAGACVDLIQVIFGTYEDEFAGENSDRIRKRLEEIKTILDDIQNLKS